MMCTGWELWLLLIGCRPEGDIEEGVRVEGWQWMKEKYKHVCDGIVEKSNYFYKEGN